MAAQSKLARHPALPIALAVLLLARSRLLDIPRALLSSKLHHPASSESELEAALQEIYRPNPDGSRTLLVPHRQRISEVTIRPLSESTLKQTAHLFPPVSAHTRSKPALDRAFFRQLASLLRLALPRQIPLVALHSFFLVARTVLSIAVARLDGRIVRDLVSADAKGFLRGLALWFILAIPSTYTNSMLRHLQSRLALRFRSDLTRYTHDLYLSAAPNLRYYRIGGEGGLEGVDQYLTSDIESWADALAALYGNLLKPALDLVLFTAQLSSTLGVRGTLALFANYYVTARILRAATPAFGRLAAVEARLEGEYRAGVGRVGREGEEVAFYDGGQRERAILWRAYLRLIKHVNSIFKIRIAYEWTEDYVIKYLWSAAGYMLIAIPVLFTRRRVSTGVQAPSSGELHDAVASRTENYISGRRLLLALADAGGRLMYAQKDLLALAGVTARLYNLLSSLHALPALPTPTSASANPDTNTSSGDIELHNVDISVPSAPSSDPLVRGLSFKLKEGDHLMITGPNGVGKTAVARVLAGLWAPGNAPSSSSSSSDDGLRAGEEEGKEKDERGVVKRPTEPGALFVVPQRAYHPAGSLLDQVIYPSTFADFKASGRTLEELEGILRDARLGYLVQREGGWHVRKEWRDVLSGGEKQRMALARVYYHRPRWAVLDECTSAVSADVEGLLYAHAKSLGITLITVSLRPALAKYHTHVLTLDGAGGYTLTRVGGAEERMGRAREERVLREKLAEVGRWEERLGVLGRALGPEGASGEVEV
ncbi:unnamed protein product [Peniophora sp. CBMAI 1063]|nr:unnamed protein product [Peniophora sp. CBMAI 1063]